jgi:hypothetical protein
MVPAVPAEGQAAHHEGGLDHGAESFEQTLQLHRVEGRQDCVPKVRVRSHDLALYPMASRRRYASLYFIACIGKDDNELLALEAVHAFVEVLDKYFDNVCELDLIFNFHKAYHILDEIILGGEVVETNKKTIRSVIKAEDDLAASARDEAPAASASSTSSMVAAVVGSKAR